MRTKKNLYNIEFFNYILHLTRRTPICFTDLIKLLPLNDKDTFKTAIFLSLKYALIYSQKIVEFYMISDRKTNIKPITVNLYNMK